MKLTSKTLKKFSSLVNQSTDDGGQYGLGTAVVNGEKQYVQLDGSSNLTPLTVASDVEDEDRILVWIQDHKVTIVGNFTSPPSGRKASDVAEDLEVVAANLTVTAESLDATIGTVGDLSDTVTKIQSTANSLTYEVGTISQNVSTLSDTITVERPHYGTCHTAKDKSPKEVDCDDLTSDSSLYDGTIVSVFFYHKNTVEAPKLKVGNTTAYPIYAYGYPLNQEISSNDDDDDDDKTVNPTECNWGKRSTVVFTFDGTNKRWVMSDSGAYAGMALTIKENTAGERVGVLSGNADYIAFNASGSISFSADGFTFANGSINSDGTLTVDKLIVKSSKLGTDTDSEDAESAKIRLDNGVYECRLVLNNNNNFGLRDITHTAWIIHENIKSQIIYLGTDDTSQTICSPLIYNTAATSTNSNLHINSDGFIKCIRNASSIRYKNVVREMNNSEIEDLYSMPVKWFKYKTSYLANEEDERYDTEMPGFIAEDLDSIMPIAVNHDQDGLPESWNTNIVVPLMFQMIKHNHELINDLLKEIQE